MPLQSKDRANVVFCYHPHFEADFSAFSGAAVPEMRILPDCERFFLITRTSSPQCGNKRLCQSTWLFCFSNILKTYALSPSFPPAGSVVGGFYWLFLWNFKEIKHQPFSMAQPNFLGCGAKAHMGAVLPVILLDEAVASWHRGKASFTVRSLSIFFRVFPFQKALWAVIRYLEGCVLENGWCFFL